MTDNISNQPDYRGEFSFLPHTDFIESLKVYPLDSVKFKAQDCFGNAYQAAKINGDKIVEGRVAVLNHGCLIDSYRHAWCKNNEGKYYDVTKDYIWNTPQFKNSLDSLIKGPMSYLYIACNEYAPCDATTFDSDEESSVGFKFSYDSLKKEIESVFSTPFSVLMSVYRNDNPDHFRTAVESISIRQSFRPSEIVIVVDGPVPDSLNTVINQLAIQFNEIKLVRMEKNGGLGNALRIGMENVSNELVARMDADDISQPDRFEKQIPAMLLNPDISIIGGQISEFIGSPDNIVGYRKVPCLNDEIHQWIKKRCPFNHMTVAFRKEDVLKAGNYIDWHFNEDYYLWIRMDESGCKFANLPQTLVNVRVGKDMYARRGGWKYFKSEKGLQNYMLKKKMISTPLYLFNMGIRFGVQVLLPNSLREIIFKMLFRKK